MNLRQLHYFYDTAQNENLSRTAKKHLVPASSVSASIKRLENDLGVPLFDRTANKIALNAKGKYLANELHFAFEKIDQAVRQITTPEAERPQIKLLIRARPKWITELIVEYISDNPNVDFIISNDYTLSNIDDFDIVVDELSEQYQNWNRFLLSLETICVKAAADSRLVGRELSFSHLEGEVFVLPSKGNGMRKLYEQTCMLHGMKPNVAIECNDRQCLQYYVQAGMGLTLGAYRALKDHTQEGIVPLHIIDFDATQCVYVFYKKGNGPNASLQDFCDFLYSKKSHNL